MFRICNNKGFLITFPNGVTLSTQFGGGDNCQNFEDPVEINLAGKKCVDSEIAVMDREGRWRTSEAMALAGKPAHAGDVAGHVTVDLWCRLVNACLQLPDEPDELKNP